MRHKIKFQLLAILALALAGMAIGLSQASAHGGGHGGRIVDSDGDGASDKCEARAGTSSSDTDSDDNGVVDGLEDTDGDGANNAAESVLRTNCNRANTRWKRIRRAEVESYTDGVLTLSIGKNGGLLSAPVSSRVICEIDDSSDSSDDDSTASIARHGEDEPGDDRGGERGGDSGGDDGGQRGDRPFGRFDGDDEDDTVACVTGDIVAGAEVRSAKIKSGKFVRIHLADPEDSE